jgi:hypothetical protein
VPYGVINYALAGVPTVRFWHDYLPTSLVARIPQNLVELQVRISPNPNPFTRRGVAHWPPSP